jgi:hypothetical protein
MSWEKMISSRSIGYACEMTLVVVSWVVKDWPRLPLKTWLVQAELVVEDRRVLRGVVGPEDGDRGVPGQQVDEEEGGHRHEEDDEDEEDGALGYVRAHPGAPLPVPAVGLCSLRRTSLDPVPYHAPHV